MSPSDKARRIRVYCRKDGQPVPPSGMQFEVYGKEKVRLVVVRGDHETARRVRLACESAGLYGGAVVLQLPHGAEFEVWEEP